MRLNSAYLGLLASTTSDRPKKRIKVYAHHISVQENVLQERGKAHTHKMSENLISQNACVFKDRYKSMSSQN